MKKKMNIVVTSDLHNRYNKIIIPKCDILIDCGDYSSLGHDHEIKRFYEWLNEQEAGHIVSIQGNHEKGWEANPKNAREIALKACPAVHLLEHDSVTIEGIKIFGSPWTPYFYNWAYNSGRTLSEAALYRKPFAGDLWKDIPLDTNILAVHGPPYDVLDELCRADGTPSGQFVGCVELRDRIVEVKPDIVCFGHIHCQGAREKHIDGISYYNAAVCDEMDYPSNGITEIVYIK